MTSALLLLVLLGALPASASDADYDAAVAALEARVAGRPGNSALAAAVEARLARVHDETGAEIRARLDALGIAPLRVPGLMYRSNPATGADLRAVEHGLGGAVPLVATDEVGSVERNARLVAHAVKKAAQGGRRVALISASKGSADVRAALEGEPELGARVALWLDLVGVLEGTPLTDGGNPGRAQAHLLMSRTAARSLSHRVRAKAAAPERFPVATRAVHFAAFPRVADVSPPAQGSFAVLRARGPNDGYVMLDAYLRAPGRVLIVPGVDHYLKSERLLPRVAAALLVLLDEIETEQMDARGPGDESGIMRAKGAR